MRLLKIAFNHRLIPSLFFVFVLGFWFHTSHSPAWFDKYSTPYMIFLLVLSLSTVPPAFLSSRALFAKKTLPSGSGGFSKNQKAAWIALASLALLYLFCAESCLEHTEKNSRSALVRSYFHPYLQLMERQDVFEEQAGVHEPASEESYRIVILGGSTWADLDAPLIQDWVQKAYPKKKIRVINAARSGHNSLHSLIKLLTRVDDLRPDMVVICHAVNDLAKGFCPKEFSIRPYQNDYGHHCLFQTNMLDVYINGRKTGHNLRLFLKTYWCSDFLKRPENRVPVPVAEWRSQNAFERNMRHIASIARSKGADVIMASQPFLYKKNMSDEEKGLLWMQPRFFTENGGIATASSLAEGMRLYNGITRRIAGEEGAYFADIEAATPKTADYIFDDVHYTQLGIRHVSGQVSQSIIASGLIEN